MKKYYLSICAIVKDEALYIEEWIAFHQLQGVEHFYIYDNMSDDSTWDILKQYESLGICTVKRIVGSGKQLTSYQNCLDTYGAESQWIAFLDCDEFLYSTKNKLPTLLHEYEKFSAVAVNWVYFGSDRQQEYSPMLVTSRFVRRGNPDRHVKTILQPDKTISTGKNAHYFLLKSPAVNEKKEQLPKVYYHTEPSIEIFRINHYHTKSKEEYMLRKSRIDVDNVDRGDLEERFKAHDINEITDYSCIIKDRAIWSQIKKNRGVDERL